MRRLLLLVPVVALALLALAVFGSKGGFEGDAVAAAATKTSAAGSSRVAFQVTGNVLGRDVRLRGQGAFDYAAARGQLRLDASSLLSGAAVEVRAVDSTLYVRLPAALTLFLPTVKPWLAVQGDRSLDALGLGELQQDPGELLTLLRASSTRVTKSGTETVRGVQTTHYTAELELTKAIEANAGALGLNAVQREQLRLAAEELRRQAKRTVVPVEVFVGEDGLVRRLTLAHDGQRVSIDFWDFGTHVDVQAPPAADVTDAKQLLQP